MAVLFNIRDVSVDRFNNTSKFLLDTNVLLWLFYPGIANPLFDETPDKYMLYTDFVSSLKNVNVQFYTTNLNIAEFCSIVEKKEFSIYKAAHRLRQYSLKRFRTLQIEREHYSYMLDTGLKLISDEFRDNIKVITPDLIAIQNFNEHILDMTCDVFDYTIVKYFNSIGINNFISDDKDFLSVDGINLFTTYLNPNYNRTPEHNNQILTNMNLF